MFWPNDHLRLLIEMLRPMGPELARRWLTVLASVPEDSREALVAELERRVAELGGHGAGGEPGGAGGAVGREGRGGVVGRASRAAGMRGSAGGGVGGGGAGGVRADALVDRLAEEVRVVYPPVQRSGYVERTEISYVTGGTGGGSAGGGVGGGAGGGGDSAEDGSRREGRVSDRGPGRGRRRGA